MNIPYNIQVIFDFIIYASIFYEFTFSLKKYQADVIILTSVKYQENDNQTLKDLNLIQVSMNLIKQLSKQFK